ncbi:MAG: alpha/beta hydrolase [Dehalococcoidia bacterium]
MASQESQMLIQMLTSQPRPATTPSLAEQRAGYVAMTAANALVAGTTVEATTSGGVPCEIVAAPGADSSRMVVYLHGGGYVIGSCETHRELASRVSEATGARVLTVDYRLAPENPYPAAVEDATFAYQSLVESGYAPSLLAIGGDSAGGGLTAALLLSIKSRGLPMPSCAFLLSPWVDLTMSGASISERAAQDPIVTKDAIENMAASYTAGAGRTQPMISPLYADLSGLPPLLVQVGTFEILHDDAASFHNIAQRAGVESMFEPYEGQIHVFQQFGPSLPEAVAALASIGAFVKSKMSVPA